MRESEIEKYLRVQVAKRGGRAYKWVSPGNRGVPDRIVMLPNSRLFFVELKSTDGKLRPEQIMQRRTILALYGNIFTVNSKEGVDELIRRFAK